MYGVQCEYITVVLFAMFSSSDNPEPSVLMCKYTCTHMYTPTQPSLYLQTLLTANYTNGRESRTAQILGARSLL
jgi:hypothetical protein